MTRYENIYRKKNQFSFGKNWNDYLTHLNNFKIEEAKTSLINFLDGAENIKNKTFIDIGCGSGLFSLAAFLLGASKVLSLDVDKSSIECVQQLKKNYNNPKNWIIKSGSVLNKKLIESSGKFDIVYSWGVLHHTGNMYQSFHNITFLTKKNGLLYIAIYNNNKGKNSLLSGSSSFWSKIKRIYSSSNIFSKKIIELLYYSYFIIGYLITFRNPFIYIKDYPKNRGMNFFIDAKDWLGGYPYEFATSDELVNFFSRYNLLTKKIKSSDNLGCHEILLLQT